jgi:hypothetical protein
MTTWIKRISYNDGGRRAAGFKTVQVGDCVNRALAILTGDYQRIRRSLEELCGRERGPNRSSPDGGVYPRTYQKLLRELGVERRHRARAWPEIPQQGRFMVELDGHVVAYIDGVIYDTYDPVEKPDQVLGYYRFG